MIATLQPPVLHYEDGPAHTRNDGSDAAEAERAYRQAFADAAAEAARWAEPDDDAIRAAEAARQAVRAGARIVDGDGTVGWAPGHAVDAAAARGRYQALASAADGWDRLIVQGTAEDRIESEAAAWLADVAAWATGEGPDAPPLFAEGALFDSGTYRGGLPESNPGGDSRSRFDSGSMGGRLPESNPSGYRLVPIGELSPAAEPDWIMPGYVAREHLTLLIGLWKAGKSTLLGYLLRDLYTGGGLATPEPADAPTLIVSEESDGQWAKRRDELGLDPGRILLAKRPSFARPSMGEWLAMMAQLTDDVRRRGIGLVIFDTIANLWPVDDENDASKMGTALNPLKDLAAAGAAVVLVHHPKKADTTEARVSRGSGALPAFVDAIVELRRTNPDTPGDRRRTLTGYGRWDIPAGRVIELEPGIGYRILGAPDELKAVDASRTLCDLLPNDPAAAMTAEDVIEAWPYPDKPGLRTVRGWLVKGAEDGVWARRGMGTRGDAFRFWIDAGEHPAPAILLGAGGEGGERGED